MTNAHSVKQKSKEYGIKMSENFHQFLTGVRKEVFFGKFLSMIKNHSTSLRLVVFDIILFLFAILCTNYSSASLIISEIMYNPLGTDESHEWIEIYNNDNSTINLTGWKFYEDETDHSINLVQGSYILQPDSYAIIADNAEQFLIDYPSYSQTLFDTSFGSLSNNGEFIALKNQNSTLIYEINYTTEIANGNGKSLEFYQSVWQESKNLYGTPGRQPDSVASSSNKGIKITIYLEKQLYVKTTYTSLFKLENLDHTTNKIDSINVTINYSIYLGSNLFQQETKTITNINSYKTSSTGAFTPLLPGNYTISVSILSLTSNDTYLLDNTDTKTIEVLDTSNIECNIALNISVEKTIYQEGESLKWDYSINNETFPFIIEYWVQDFFDTIYKSKYNTSNTDKKSWKTSIDEQDRALLIKSKLHPFCNDTNLTDNSQETMIIVLSANKQSTSSINDEDSILKIKNVVSEAKFGDNIQIEVETYRGNTGKSVINLYAEKNDKKISEITKFSLEHKYDDYNGKLPLQIKSNCNLEFEQGDYTIILEGIDEQDKETISINGFKKGVCELTKSTKEKEQQTSETKEKTTKSTISKKEEKPVNLKEYNIINQLLCTDSIHPQNIIYESKNEKNKKILPYLIIVTMLVLSLILFYKRAMS
jgi:hypothetical protein